MLAACPSLRELHTNDWKSACVQLVQVFVKYTPY